MIRYALAAARVAALVLGGLLYKETRRAATLATQNAALEASLATATFRIELRQSAEKRLVRELERQAVKARQYDEIRKALLEGGEDEDLPEWFAAWLNDWLGRMWRDGGAD